MSRLTSKEVANMMEAYNAVYTPQITEEQLWEEVEDWVNSLVEEGYDLSEYSWEEMYEAYIEEQGGSRSSLGPIRPEVQARWNAIGNTLAYGNPEGRRSSTQTPAQRNQARMRPGRSSSPATSKPSNQPYQSPFAGKRDEAFAKARQIQGSPVVGPRAASAAAAGGAAASAAGARPAAAAPAGARPAAGAPTGKPAPAASTPARASSPANATTAQKIAGGTEVYNKQRAAGDFKAASETGKQVFSAAQPKLAAAAAERERTRGTSATTNPLMKDFKSRLPAPAPAPTTTSSTSSPFTNTAAAKSAVTAATKPAPAPAPKPIPAATGSKKPGSIVSHYDPFDVVIGHLLDEGYADSEESALAIMANMSEEWRENIVEAEVLAAKGGVPGTVQVKKTKEGGFLGIGAKTVSRPVPGTFKPKDVSSSDAARYNVGVDRKFGGAAPGKEPTKSALSTQKTAERSGHSGYMQVRDPGSLPDTGLPGRASPGRASDQNFAKGKPRNY